MNINCARILKAVDAYRYLNVLDAGHKGQKNCFCTYYVNNNDRRSCMEILWFSKRSINLRIDGTQVDREHTMYNIACRCQDNNN